MRVGLRRPAIAALLAAVAGPAAAANDPRSREQWNMPLIGAEAAWATGTGAGITIAVVDTGVDLGHEDLKDKLRPGWNFVSPGQPPQDDHGHGTHVAGIAAAATNNGRGVVGTAPDAAILPLKVLDQEGSGTYDNVAAAIRWATDHGAHVVNLSLGATGNAVFGSPEQFVAAIGYAWSKGVICVVVAGNDFVLTSDFGDEPALVVSATTRHDQAAVYSNGVGAADWGLAAPGGAGLGARADNILSTYWPHVEGTPPTAVRYEAYETSAGTSMAAPHVAGAAAVLRSLGLTPQQAVDRLLRTAKDLGRRGNDSVYGHGRLDLAKAVSGLRPAGSPTQATAGGRPSGSDGRSTASGPGAAPGAGGDARGATPAADADPSPDIDVAASGEPHGEELPDGAGGRGAGARADDDRAPQPQARRPWAALLAALALEAAVAAALLRARGGGGGR